MQKNVLAVCDSDAAYITRLVNYFSSKKHIPFEIHAFTKTDIFMNFIKSGRVDVLLSSDDMYYVINRSSDGCCFKELFILSEDGVSASADRDHTILKYQSAENILRHLMNYYADAETVIHDCNGNIIGQELIGIYSPIKRSLKTTFALTLGQILADSKHVLYINLEEYSGFSGLLNKNYTSDMSDLMYYISQNKPNFIWKLAAMVQNIGSLEYLPPAHSPLDLKHITTEQWMAFFAELERCSYDAIILDLGDSINGIYNILNLCTKIYTPTRDDSVSYAKLMQYEELLKKMNHDDILEKTRKLGFAKFKAMDRDIGSLIYSDLGKYTRDILIQEGLI